MGYAARPWTRAAIVLPRFGIVDAPLSMRVTAICGSDRMPAASRVRRPTALAVSQGGARGAAPRPGGGRVAAAGEGGGRLLSRGGAPLGGWRPPGRAPGLAVGARGGAMGASPRAGALVALRPTARGFVVVSGP